MKTTDLAGMGSNHLLGIRPTRIVPCNGCSVCCQGDVVYLHPECGDDASLYQTEDVGDGRLMLAHKPNGDCVYLERKKGCSIWDRRPTVCRELDCLIFLNPVVAATLPDGSRRVSRLIRAAKKRRKRR